MASTEEKIIALMAVSENLKDNAIEQQKEVADTIALARETLKNYREVSENAVNELKSQTANISLKVQSSIRTEIQKIDIAEALQGRLNEHFLDIDKAVKKLATSAEKQADNFNQSAERVTTKINDRVSNMQSCFWIYLLGLIIFAIITIGCSIFFAKSVINESNQEIRSLKQQIVELTSKTKH